MFRNFIKIALRNFLKEKYYAVLNILGLAIGIASALLIAEYVTNELSYDQHHPEVNNTYRVNQTNFWSPDGGVMGSTVLPLAKAMEEEFPEIYQTLRINTPNPTYFRNESGDIVHHENSVLAVDSTFFDFFGFEMLHGDPGTALNKLNTSVLTYDQAIKYFGQTDVVGRTLLMGDNKTPIEITGVLKKKQPKTHFDFDMLISIYSNPDVKTFEWSWIWTQAVTYVKIKGDVNDFQPRLDQVATKYAQGAFRRLGMELEEFEKEKGKITFYLQPVQDIHLNSGKVENRIGVDGNIFYVYVLSAIGGIVILLALINFINLATARASGRAKEIGVKKVLGSSRKILILQLLVESFIITLSATVVSLGLMELMKIGVNQLFDVELYLTLWDIPELIIGLLVLPFITAFLSGIYPAFYLTSISTVQTLKGKPMKSGEGLLLRNGLVIFQFVMAIALMVSTIIISKQLNFFKHGEMGFKKENVLVINNIEKLEKGQSAYLEFLKAQPEVERVSVASVTPGLGSPEDLFVSTKNPDRKVSMGAIKIDEHYIDELGLKVIAGRNFNVNQNEQSNIIVNEMAAHSFGWNAEESLGETISYFGTEFTIVGVIRNFHTMPFYYPVAPVIFFDLDAKIWNDTRHALLKVDMDQAQSMVNKLEDKWNSYQSASPFVFNYLQENLASIYKREQLLYNLFSVFAILAMVIALMGLIGLAAYVTSQRVKELGVRKVLGASITQLTIMINSDFSRLILIACMVACPIAYWLMNNWLMQFEFHVAIGWQPFLLAVTISFVISSIVISYYAIRSALLNPAHTLKEE